MSKFKIGQRVKMKKGCDAGFNPTPEAKGTIIGKSGFTEEFAVEFDKNIDGHTCGSLEEGRSKDLHGWFVSPKEIELIKKPSRHKYIPSMVTHIVGAH